jgi:S-adenosylmethionine synthetase
VTKPLPPILHYSAAEPYTKYEMCLVFAQILNLPHAHIKPDATEPAGSGTTRPKNTQLDTSETEALGVEDGLGLTGFEEWWSAHLRR